MMNKREIKEIPENMYVRALAFHREAMSAIERWSMERAIDILRGKTPKKTK